MQLAAHSYTRVRVGVLFGKTQIFTWHLCMCITRVSFRSCLKQHNHKCLYSYEKESTRTEYVALVVSIDVFACKVDVSLSFTRRKIKAKGKRDSLPSPGCELANASHSTGLKKIWVHRYPIMDSRKSVSPLAINIKMV